MKTIKQNFLRALLALLMCYVNPLYGQAPYQFNYQGVARQANGQPLPNKKIALRLSILSDADNGPVAYSETREVTTNPFGLYTVQIGSDGAQSKTGSIAAVKWEDGSKYMKVEISPDGDQRYQVAGSNQLLSVPYALFAGNVKDAKPAQTAWYENKTHQPATTSDQDVYQIGKVGVMTKEPVTPLDVRGAVRFGTPILDAVIGNQSAAFGHLNKATAVNSTAFGIQNEASGNNSMAFGQQTLASGENATAFGLRNHATGRMATAFGSDNLASGSRATIFGTLSKASGDYSTSIGSTNNVSGFMSTVIGGGLRAEGDFQFVAGSSNLPIREAAFQIGNGSPNSSGDYRNAMTVMKDGSALIGNSTGIPNSTLQVLGSLSLPVRVIESGQPATNDYTLLVRGSIVLPDPAPANKDRIYVFVLDFAGNAELSGKIRQQGKRPVSLTLKDVAGNRGYTLHSDGSDWIVTGQF